jgi:hypothetical protein
MNGRSTIHNNAAGGVSGGGGIFIDSNVDGSGTVIGAVPATTCPPTGNANVYCNTPQNVVPVRADVRISPGFASGLQGDGSTTYLYDFGSLDAGSSKTTTFTVTNYGFAASQTLTVSGSGDSSFMLANDACSTQSLAVSGGSCTFDLKYPTHHGGMPGWQLQLRGAGQRHNGEIHRPNGIWRVLASRPRASGEALATVGDKGRGGGLQGSPPPPFLSLVGHDGGAWDGRRRRADTKRR